MIFLEDQPIFLQIAEWISDRILDGTYPTGSNVPSVRELAVRMEVNPNTAMRAVERLQRDGLIYPKRGIGFYVDASARERILVKRMERFKNERVPQLVAEMRLLNISLEKLCKLTEDELNRQHTEDEK
ncbi:GntR family transcriptional regulator [Porphyromonas macacae]|uniref:Transcriptional regulatory protein PtsJ n=1 Tax=Porphyromonas macacae TaxID=28115 RepID=A0A379DKP4_9PORP|nr:GntR family transcriptional regulator [Porphyromonas macacae]KGN99705.1 GntR family transcriptional regulator [Porphyromonas macacae]SUB78524.1 transcriptional regulatory protein PtsJ [Porphyromonas macacae]